MSREMSAYGWLLLLAPLLAAGLDQLLGDPPRFPHPVQAMGALIQGLRRPLEAWAGDRPGRLRLAGGLITLTTVGASAAVGLTLERLAQWGWQISPAAGLALSLPLLLGLASTLARRSLRQAVEAVLVRLPQPEPQPPGLAPDPVRLDAARQRLAWIVGRDTDGLEEADILRALAETASENAVDGVFAPLFWLLLGSALALIAAIQGAASEALIGAAPAGLMVCPGPLSLAWLFKAASTLDSMLGYRRGRLRWLGTAGARLDDALTWVPCRLVAVTLPLAAGRPGRCLRWFRQALLQGRPDPSPNAGVSQAAYALAAGVRLGGLNRYGGETREKPILAPDQPAADRPAVHRILGLSDRLMGLWLLLWGLLAWLGCGVLLGRVVP